MRPLIAATLSEQANFDLPSVKFQDFIDTVTESRGILYYDGDWQYRAPNTLSREDVYRIAVQWWPRSASAQAVEIAYCESGFDANAHNSKGEDSRDLWQINVGPGAHPRLVNENLWRPITNAYYAELIWEDAGRSWIPWYNCAHKLGYLHLEGIDFYD